MEEWKKGTKPSKEAIEEGGASKKKGRKEERKKHREERKNIGRKKRTKE